MSISTITVALVILGGFFLCYKNFNELAEKTSPKVTGTLYLKEGLSPDEIEIVRARVLGLSKVAGVEFKSKNTVVAELQTFLGESNSALPGSELFPDILEIQLTPDSTAQDVQPLKGALTPITNVAEVDFSEDWVAKYKKVRKMLNLFGAFLFICIVLGCTFILANFMGVRHQSRRSEIEIVRLVGADPSFVFTPYVWEALIEGTAGASLALAILFFLKQLFVTLINVQWTSILGIKQWAYLSPLQAIGVLFLGVFIAFCGSLTVLFRTPQPAT